MNNRPAPAPPTEYRLQLNNLLQDCGWEARFTWEEDEKDGPDHEPTWRAACNCPFHFSPCLLGSHLCPIVDGHEYGQGEGKTIRLAREEAARRVLQRLLFQNTVLPLIKRRQD